MIFRAAALCLAAVALIAAGEPDAKTGDAPATAPASPEAQAIIDGCWKISQDQRDSGVTPEMREGAADTVACLEKAVVDQTETLFDPQTLSRKEAQGEIDRLREAYEGYYDALLNHNRGCAPDCGSENQPVPNIEYAKLLEKMLRDIFSVRDEYEIAK